MPREREGSEECLNQAPFRTRKNGAFRQTSEPSWDVDSEECDNIAYFRAFRRTVNLADASPLGQLPIAQRRIVGDRLLQFRQLVAELAA
jgi:hypothetical protein